MDLVSKSYANTIRVSQRVLSPITTPGNSISGSHSRSSDTSFPIIVIAVNRHFGHGRFSLSPRRPEDALTAQSPAIEHRGLDESVIRSIPTFQFKKSDGKRSPCECAVCLNEFKEDEKLRRIPNCSHVFHIDCIDVWLQGNANCPLCRTNISRNTTINGGPSSTQQDHPSSTINGDEDYVVIELSHNNSTTDELSTRSSTSLSPSPMKKQGRKLLKGTSMGDEMDRYQRQERRICGGSANKEVDFNGFIGGSAAVFSSSRSHETEQARQ
ncbi:electron transfer flavoprotein subunit beta [Hibiscus syriacus]|uniref:RING-type E3 ubiquitin transferase n=1 Tax=Hibiscus syriacus TaxID=106335 RepID=A0A6A3C7G7_HIBSY|nr:electron transfer flavoprotein subunit beta [Hibiscus syriacus]